MKIALISDTHFGYKKNAKWHLEYEEWFYNNLFFPTLLKNNINHIIHMGDLFDNPRVVATETFYHAKQFFFDKLVEYDITMDLIIGNHDIVFRNNNSININEFLGQYRNFIRVIDEPAIYNLDNIMVVYCPWIHDENKDRCVELIKQGGEGVARFCFGHFEMVGFKQNYTDRLSDKGFEDVSIFAGYDKVYSGHYHEPSNRGNIFYPGAPYHFSSSDLNGIRGFSLIDLGTGEREHISNPWLLHRTVNYDDTKKLPDLSRIEPAYIQILVVNKTDQKKFDEFKMNANDSHHYGVLFNDDVIQESVKIAVEAGEDVKETRDEFDIFLDLTESRNNPERLELATILYKEAKAKCEIDET